MLFALFLYLPQLLRQSSYFSEAVLASSKHLRLSLVKNAPPLLHSVKTVVID